MSGVANLRLSRRRIGCAVLGLLVALSSTLVLAPRALAAQGPYEPNDSILNAAGPLAFGQTYTAGLETPGDRDFFFFYVTSPDPTQVVLTAKNLGGGTDASGINAAIVDSLGNPIDAFAYALANGKEATGTTALGPQKYFVEVSSVEGSAGGMSYSLATGGGNGAFGTYAQIAARCATATAAVTAAQTGLGRAQAKLQRAIARLRRARYGTRDARVAARAGYRKAKARVTAKRKALKAAEKSQSPWCVIPQ